MRRPSRHLLPAAARIAAAALVLAIAILATRDSVEATSFNPTASVTLGDSSPGAKSDMVSIFGTPAPDANFGTMIGFTPADFGVPKSIDVPLGAIVVALEYQTKLGSLNNPCSASTTLKFNMMNAGTNISDTVVRLNTTNPTHNDGFDDVNPKNGLPDAVDHYPDHLTRLFPGLTPRARYYGQASASGTPVDLNFVVFEPGTKLSNEVNPDPRLGYPSVTVLLDPAPVNPPAPSPITDFCTPLNITATYFGASKDNICSTSGTMPGECKVVGGLLQGVPGTGSTPDEGGATFRKNPSASGLFPFTFFAVSLWDSDNDGVENELDPCPLTPDPSWDPRTGGVGDQDGDGLPNSCDPNPSVASTVTVAPDEDKDGYGNRGDNCPLVANGLVNAQGQPDPAGTPNQSSQLDTDKDGIGDPCDGPNGSLANDPTNAGAAHRHATCKVAGVAIGTGGTAGVDPLKVQPCDPRALLAGAASPTPAPAGGPDGGIGSLAPAASSIPAWAAIASGLGSAGFLGSLGAFVSRIRRRRR